MNMKQFPVIDPTATGKNIIRLRAERGMSVRDLQAYFGFEEPQAIYKWQQGKSLPSVDNLYALGALFEVPMEDILVSRTSQLNLISRLYDHRRFQYHEIRAVLLGFVHFQRQNHHALQHSGKWAFHLLMRLEKLLRPLYRHQA